MTRGAFASFGTVLKGFRTPSGLTQQTLAEKLGVRRNTIGSWERGDFLPQSKGVVLELARHLHLDDEETRQLLEASLTLAPHWSVPLPRNLYFTGREEILEELHTQLGVDRAVALTQSSALHGLGGIGKTQIALEYAYRHALEYSAVFWIGAETDEQVIASLLRIAEMLQLPERENQDQQRVIEAVQRWLSIHRQWLLIWDNVEDLDLLPRFLPSTRSGALLITTRRRALGTHARGLDLAPMEREEGILFLLRRAKVLEAEAIGEHMQQFAELMPAQYAVASELVTVLGGLPLALDQAGAYLEETQCGLPAYLDLFRTRRAVLLQQRGDGSRNHPASVTTTFALAITATAERHPAVLDLLRACAMLHPDAIPEELFRQGSEHLGTTLEDACGDPLEWDGMVRIACSYSLLARQPGEQALSLHRLVQAVLLDTMTEGEREQWNQQVIGALDALFPEMSSLTGHAARKESERLLPHTLLCLHRARAASDSLILASLACKTAHCLRERGWYAQAEPLYHRALQIREQTLGPDHPEVASLLDGLAFLFWQQGKYAQTGPLSHRALQIREQILGPAHPEVATSLHFLADFFREQGKYAQAESLYYRALQIREQTMGPDHPEVASSLSGLAFLFWQQGKDAQAEPLYHRALQIWEQAPEPDNPHEAILLHDLALLYGQQGKYAQAESLYLRALRIWEQALGPEDPWVAHPLNNMATLYREQGRYEEAEPLSHRALQIWEQALGPEHPWVAYALHGLALLYGQQGKYAQAEPLYRRTLSIRERHLGSQHPETAETLHALAVFRKIQGNGSEALTLAQRALSIRSQALGDAHHKTAATRTLCAQLLWKQVKEHAEPSGEAVPNSHSEECRVDLEPFSLREVVPISPAENDLLQGFLDTHCELHPLAWCRISELWHAYQQWTAFVRHAIPLSRRAFASQIKARGCRPDRTSTMRIWRGIRLRDKTL